MDVLLVMFKADGSRKEFPISKTRIKIGRTQRCELRVPLSSVSREHCEILIEKDGVTLRDLGSSNGTYHNHKRVQVAPLKAGDEIAIGPVVFTVVINGQPARLQPALPPKSPPRVGKTSPLRSGQPRMLPTVAPDDEVDLLRSDDEAYSPTPDLDEPHPRPGGVRVDGDDIVPPGCPDSPDDSKLQSDRSGSRCPAPI